MDQFTNGTVNLQDSVSDADAKCSLWVFGYGSLCWNPGFEFRKAVMGHIKGYSRKFWQGNDKHRGTIEKPGRVATLVKDDITSIVQGVAFQITDARALDYLEKRECQLGGYVTERTTFYPASEGLSLTVTLYIATCKNSLWLGDAPLCDIAKQITYASGPCGYNAEYLLRLANFMHHHFPGEDDDHLFELEKLVKAYIEKSNLCYKTLMGCGKNCITFIKVESKNGDFAVENQEQRDAFKFSTNFYDDALPCLNM